MIFFKFKEYYIEYKDEKFNLNQIYYILGYNLKEKNLYVTKEELIYYYLNQDNFEDIKFIDFLNYYF